MGAVGVALSFLFPPAGLALLGISVLMTLKTAYDIVNRERTLDAVTYKNLAEHEAELESVFPEDSSRRKASTGAVKTALNIEPTVEHKEKNHGLDEPSVPAQQPEAKYSLNAGTGDAPILHSHQGNNLTYKP